MARNVRGSVIIYPMRQFRPLLNCSSLRGLFQSRMLSNPEVFEKIQKNSSVQIDESLLKLG